MAETRVAYKIEEETLQRMLSQAHQHVEVHGPCTTAELKLVMRQYVDGSKRRRIRITDPLTTPPTTWVLHHSPSLSAVDRRGDDLVWTDDLDDEAHGVTLPEEVARGVFGADPLPAIPIETVSFSRYRTLFDTSLALAPFTVLVGPNGAGKSNLLEGLFRLLRLSDYAIDSALGEPAARARLTTFGSIEPVSIECRGPGGASLGVTWHDTFEPRVFVNGERENVPRNNPIARAFGPARRFWFESDYISGVTYSDHSVPGVDARGADAQAVLAHLAAEDPERFRAIVERVREAIPSVEDLRAPCIERDLGVHRAEGYALEAKCAGHWVSSELLSEGTLMVIAVQAILGMPLSFPRVLLLDDLDRSLDPRAQRALVEQLKRETASGALQVVASTRSPFVLDAVDPSCIRVVQLNEQGHTQVDPLESLPAWQDRPGQRTPGEFWLRAGPNWASRV